MKKLLKKMFKQIGLELIKYRMHVEDILTMFHFDVVLDVGANTGQFAEYIRSHGYDGRIVSFEPVKEAYEQLNSKAMKENKWVAVNVALGKREAVKTINVAHSSVYSSFLEPLQIVEDFAGDAIKSSAQEPVTVCTLDSQYLTHVRGCKNVFLKIDTQGFEKQVLLGAAESLCAIKGVQVELSLRPLYEGEALLTDIIAFLEGQGFNLALIDPVTYDKKKGVLLQIDCIFLKNDFGPFADRSIQE